MTEKEKWQFVELGEVCKIKRGSTITKKQTKKGKIPVIAGGQKPAYYHNEANREPPVITVSASGAYAGFVNFFDEPIYASDCSTIQTIDKKRFDIQFVYRFLKSKQNEIYQFKQGGAQPHVYPKDLESILIPIPPLSEQKRIVAKLSKQMKIVERMKKDAEEQIKAVKSLSTSFLKEMQGKKKLPRSWQWIKLGNICQINPRRSKEFNREDDKLTTFIPMDAVNATAGKVDKPKIRPYGEIKKGYTFFSDGDVLFAKITPCMQNRKHFIARNSLDGIGFASTEFHVLRPSDFLLAEWMHFYLRLPAIIKEATYHFTGTAGQQRVPDSFLKELSIPLPSLSEQKRIVAKIERQISIQNEIKSMAETQLEAVNALPSSFLRQEFRENMWR